tara:strand:+ start:7340 stop:8278 length:939 start_codon:yes stop_codon:yes gene_type:complete
MRNLQYIISQVRKQTENEDVSDFAGIQDTEFIQYLNDAQHRLQGIIIASHPRVFLEEKIISVVSDQESYELPSDCYLGNKVHNIEYSSTGDENNYYVLEETTLKRRNPGVAGSPSHYIRMSGKILLSPQPSGTGKLRITYAARVRELDIRRAKVEVAPTISSSGSWTIALDNANLTTDITSLEEHDYICVIDKEGKSIVKNIPITSVTSELMTLEAHTVDSESGETNTSITDAHYIVGGKDTTSHGDLPRSVERYIISYCAWKILKRDSSVDSAEAQQELQGLASEIVNSYALISDDVQFVPQLNSWDDWGS